jgi:hypothetical protein
LTFHYNTFFILLFIIKNAYKTPFFNTRRSYVLNRAALVPPKRLRNRWNNIPSKQGLNNRLPKLSPEQDLALIYTLNRLDKCKLPARVPILISIANGILARAHLENTPPPTISVSWGVRWLARHPEFSVVKGKTLAMARKSVYDPVNISRWYTVL